MPGICATSIWPLPMAENEINAAVSGENCRQERDEGRRALCARQGRPIRRPRLPAPAEHVLHNGDVTSAEFFWYAVSLPDGMPLDALLTSAHSVRYLAVHLPRLRPVEQRSCFAFERRSSSW